MDTKIYILLTLVCIFGIVVCEDHFSSVWCHGDHEDHRHCAFSNLCYSPNSRQFVFFHDNRSTISGISSPDDQRHLSKLTSISGQDDFYFDYAVFPYQEAYQEFNIERVDDPVLIVKRWNAEDILHVVHDDLMPMYFTMKHMCFGDANECYAKYHLAVTDDGEPSKYNSFYNLLHRSKILFLDKEDKGKQYIKCFTKALIGLDHDSLWYDHGLDRSQGPLEASRVRPAYLEEFRDAVLAKLAHTHTNFQLEFPDIVYVHLNETDQLVNIVEVLNLIAKEFKISSKKDDSEVKIAILNFETHSPEHIFRTVSKAQLIIGCHGSQMISSLFLPKSASAIIEVFPYGLDPESFSFTKVMAEVRGVAYHPWVNKDKALTTGFVNRKPEQGGLKHLDPDIQDAIQMMEHVGNANYKDPAYLYHLYQNTKVDIKQFELVVKEAMKSLQKKDLATKTFDDWHIPSKVYDIGCKIKTPKSTDRKEPYIQITWKRPLNLKFVNHKQVIYELQVETESADPHSGSDMVRESSTKDTLQDIFDVNLKKTRYLNVWITSVMDSGLRGIEAFYKCDLDHQMAY